MSLISKNFPLLLGSASPRRRALLQDLGIPLVLAAPAIVEDVFPDERPHDYVQRIVAAKFAAIAELGMAANCSALLVADTIVVLDGDILGKPKDLVEAERLVSRLSGRTHEVLTRYALGAATRSAEPTLARTVASRVTLRAAAPSELARYARTGEGLDKAGAYAVQGIGAFLVERIEGSYSNVVGLPVCEVVRDLQQLGWLVDFPAAPEASREAG